MDKVSLPLRESLSELKVVSKAALDDWEKSLSGYIDGKLLDYLRQRVQLILDKMGRGFIVELDPVKADFIGEGSLAPAMLLDKDEYDLVKEKLSAAFRKQIHLANPSMFDRREAGRQADLLISILEDSIAVSLILAVYKEMEILTSEKSRMQKALWSMTQLLERDRQRLAFDLHDGPAQALSSALLQVDILDDLVASTEAKRELASLKSILSQCLQELRASIYSLKPQYMLRGGLIERIEGLAKQFSSRAGIGFEVNLTSEDREVPEIVGINIFRVVQEALNNVQKHAHASHVVVSVCFGEAEVRCSVEDDGIGFNVSKQYGYTEELSGYGLASMRDRVAQLSGYFEVDSRPGGGTCIRFSIPL